MGSSSGSGPTNGPINTNWNPTGAGGGALGNWDVVGKAIDNINPYVKAARKPTANSAGSTDFGYGVGNAPKLNDYEGITSQGAYGGTNLKGGFNYAPTQIDMKGAQSFNNLESYANSKGPSPWLNLTNQKIGLEQGQMRDQGARQATQGLMSANDNLAAQGGLSGGDAARMQMQAMRNKLASNTAAGNYGAMGRTNAGIQDQQMKLSAQQGLAGMEAQKAQANTNILNDASKFNIGNKIGDIAAGRAGELFKYGEDMKGFTGAKLADATGNAGKK